MRTEDQLDSYQQSQLQDARLLPPADGAWVSSFLSQDIDAEKQRIKECKAIDQDHVEALLTVLSRQGEGASAFLLSQEANNIADENRLAREAALQGFPEGQYEWASDLLSGQGFFHPQPGDPSAVDYLRSAADELASARAMLAICEYRGCSGETPDPQQAILDARAAAQQGDPDAIVSLASSAALSLISPSEAQAWALFDVALKQRGCRGNGVNVKWMQSMTAQSANASAEAQVLADQYWQLYGASAMQNLGC
jgi:TPR repeat protein